MSTSKHIDLICIVAIAITLLLTALFMNGEALGIEAVSDGDAGDGRFTANDLKGDWDTAGATYITLSGDGGHVSGNGAYVYGGGVHIVYAGRYVISGGLTDGSIIVDADGDDKIWILLDGVSLHCEDNAAILIEQAGKVFLTLAEGTENVISGGAEYTAEAVSNGIDGVIYSRDDLTINGGGALSVTAAYRHGIVCNDDLVITGGRIAVTAAQDGVHANDSFRFANAALTINAGDDGITVSNDDDTAWLYVESGNISIPSCYEGIEAIDITIAGGVIDIRPTDDGINANGRGDHSVIRITGGDITVINENGRDADGLDSNGSIHISGGNTFISVNTSSYALDYGSENGGVCKISGGTVIAAGGSTMAEGFDSSSEQGFIMYSASANAGTAVTLMNAAGDTLISESVPCTFTSIVLSAPGLEVGQTVILDIGGERTELTVDNSSSGGLGFGGMFGGGTRGDMFGGRGGGNRFSMEQRGVTETTDVRTITLSALSAGDIGRGDMVQTPGGDFTRGEMPQTPGGDFMRGEMPQTPGDDLADGETPQMPDGETPQAQGGGFVRGGDQRGGEQFAQWGKTQERAQGGADAGSPAASSDALLLTGGSVLVLLAGILVAVKVKH